MEQKIILGAVIVLVVAAIAIYVMSPDSAKSPVTKTDVPPGTYTALAQCIASSGTKFYGAFWCPHCQEQKAKFGDAAKLLPYIECSLPDKSGITKECKDAGVEGFPTWVFGNGSRKTGEVPLADLATITGCMLPAGSDTTATTTSTVTPAPGIQITPIEVKPEVQ